LVSALQDRNPTTTRCLQAAPTVLILGLNFVAACVAYETFGWHYIRGYREVTTFLIYPAILFLAGGNLIASLIAAALNREGKSANFQIPAAFLLSAAMLTLSLPIAPSIGRFLNHSLILRTSIVDAAAYQDDALVTKLLLAGADPKTRGRPGLQATALHYMAASGKSEVVELLLKKGADPNARANTFREYPLHWAIFNRAPQSTVLLLLKYGADPKLADREGHTAFDHAANHPEPEGAWLRQTMSGLPYDPLPREAPRPAQQP
jgi:hypothetical protein